MLFFPSHYRRPYLLASGRRVRTSATQEHCPESPPKLVYGPPDLPALSLTLLAKTARLVLSNLTFIVELVSSGLPQDPSSLNPANPKLSLPMIAIASRHLADSVLLHAITFPFIKSA
jgi:hypothetical protein